MMSRHYGLQIDDVVMVEAFGTSIGPGTVARFDPTDNNRAYLLLDDGREYAAVAEWCRVISRKPQPGEADV